MTTTSICLACFKVEIQLGPDNVRLCPAVQPS